MKQSKRRLLILNTITMLFFASTEIVESMMPFFLLYYLGTSMFVVGLIEGFSEAFSNFLKIFGGFFSDFVRRVNIIKFGLLSLLFSMLTFPLSKKWSDIIAPVFLKNVSEGAVIPAKDYYISYHYKTKEVRLFSLNRMFENIGEVLGICIVFLYSMIFLSYGITYIFFIPLILISVAILLSFFLKERPVSKPIKRVVSWKIFYPKYLLLFSIFSIINFGYSFYILKVQSQTGNITVSIGIYLLFGLILILATSVSGNYFERIGELKFLKLTLFMFLISHFFLIVFPIVGFLSMAIADAMFEIGLWGTIGRRIKYRKGFVFGAYHFTVGITSLISGVGVGYIWDRFGSDAPFYLGIISTVLGYLYLSKVIER